VTFASFEVPEKPQLSTGGAARLIKDATALGTAGADAVNFAVDAASMRPPYIFEDTLFFVYGAISWTPFLKPLPRPHGQENEAAHVCGKHHATSIWLEPVTILQQVFPLPRLENAPARAGGGPRITGIVLPKAWANAGAFSPLTLKSKLAHY
jgi:hypothetical protein